MTTVAQSIAAAIAGDPVALAELRTAIGVANPTALDTAPLAYTVATLAHDLGASTKTVRGAIHRGELQGVKRGSRWLISVEAVHAWTDGERKPIARLRRTEGVKRSRVGGPSLHTVLCDLPATDHPHNGKKGG
jgi:excisionase family DNA binding protein